MKLHLVRNSSLPVLSFMAGKNNYIIRDYQTRSGTHEYRMQDMGIDSSPFACFGLTDPVIISHCVGKY